MNRSLRSAVKRSSTNDIKPSSLSLALLRTCRRIRHEIGDRWMNMVLFDFDDTVSMLDKLTTLPATIISKLRHMRVGISPTELNWYLVRLNRVMVNYSLTSTLKLVPSLRLDTLTVVSYTDGYMEYNALERLVQDSTGWRELRFSSRDSKILGYSFGRR